MFCSMRGVDKRLVSLKRLKKEIILHEIRHAFIFDCKNEHYYPVWQYLLEQECDSAYMCGEEYNNILSKMIYVRRSARHRALYKPKVLTKLKEHKLAPERKAKSDMVWAVLRPIALIKFNKQHMLNDLSEMRGANRYER